VQDSVQPCEVHTMPAHSAPRLTMRYAAPAPEHLRRATAALDRAIGPEVSENDAPSDGATDTQVDTRTRQAS